MLRRFLQVAGCRPGPRGPHKLTGQILTWAEQQLAASPGLRLAQLAPLIQESFGVHPRTVEKALARRRERHRLAPAPRALRDDRHPDLRRRRPVEGDSTAAGIDGAPRQ